MPVVRQEDGAWHIRLGPDESESFAEGHPAYLEALPRYLTAMDVAFARARERNEFEFLFTLLGVRGTQDAGWNPYESTQEAFRSMYLVQKDIKDPITQRHLQLWTYGHVLEASEPYELLSNLIGIAQGQRFSSRRFPPNKRGRSQSPSEKIAALELAASRAGVEQVVMPVREAWDRQLRNAIFHADYILHEAEVRTLRPMRIYSSDEIMTLLNRAHAYFEAICGLQLSFIQSYTEERLVEGAYPGFAADPDEKAIVIVREGHGAVGLKDAWTVEQLRAGKIPFRLVRATRAEIALLDRDPTRATLPPRAPITGSKQDPEDRG